MKILGIILGVFALAAAAITFACCAVSGGKRR